MKTVMRQALYALIAALHISLPLLYGDADLSGLKPLG